MRWPLLLLLLPLSGCDAIKGPLGMNKDAEAIGFACRVSQKLPEQCIKENPNLSPTAILEGWKKGDEEVRTKQYGVTLNGPAAPPPAPAAEGEAATEEEKPKEEPKP